MSKRMTQSEIIDICTSLVERDHGGCEQHTCDICTSMRENAWLWAIELWAGCGAACPEFDRLYSRLGPKFRRDAEKHREIVCDVPSIDCGHCNAVIRYPDEVDHYCDSCGKNALFSKWRLNMRKVLKYVPGNDFALNTGHQGKLRLVA